MHDTTQTRQFQLLVGPGQFGGHFLLVPLWIVKLGSSRLPMSAAPAWTWPGLDPVVGGR
jgi:hypothetical protein